MPLTEPLSPRATSTAANKKKACISHEGAISGGKRWFLALRWAPAPVPMWACLPPDHPSSLPLDSWTQPRLGSEPTPGSGLSLKLHIQDKSDSSIRQDIVLFKMLFKAKGYARIPRNSKHWGLQGGREGRGGQDVGLWGADSSLEEPLLAWIVITCVDNNCCYLPMLSGSADSFLPELIYSSPLHGRWVFISPFYR